MELVLGLLVALVVSCVGLPPEPSSKGSVVLGTLTAYAVEGGNLPASVLPVQNQNSSVTTGNEKNSSSSISASSSTMAGARDSSFHHDESRPPAAAAVTGIMKQTIAVEEHHSANVTSSIIREPVANVSTSTTPPRASSIVSEPKVSSTTPLGISASSNTSRTDSSRKKSKPGLTYDADDLPRDANGKPIVTKEDLISSGPAFDYVVPIVIATLAIPLVAVLGAFLYKKSRDFWDRRHYRRMDFLIDGMYND